MTQLSLILAAPTDAALEFASARSEGHLAIGIT